MNVLVINGSPKGKKSNTYQLSTSFVAGLKEATTDISIDEIDVCKLNINFCLGCFSCWNKTPGKCILNDDMNKVIERLLWADITIWSFPLYYYSVPSKLKTLIDRQLPMVHPFMTQDSESGSHPSRYDMSNKKNVLISTCGFYTTKGNYDSVLPLFDHLLGKNNYETIFCSQGELFRVPELKNKTDQYLESVKAAGKEYSTTGISSNTRAKLETLLFPKETFEEMANASWGVERETGKKTDESLVFTKQMAALYNKKSYSGKDLVIEFCYTDINKTYQILLQKDGHKVITENFLPFTTKIETPFSLWKDIACGKISGQDALMQQKYRVMGDFNLMIHWDKYFGSSTEQENSPKEHKAQNQKNTNMAILLIPWIVFWVTASINTFKGTWIPIATCTLLSIIFFRNKKTIYDAISNSLVNLFALSLFFGCNINIILPISYFAFGIMWAISCLFKIPLTAYYSANEYNGDEAFNNPLFIKTNRILTFLWGILYILISVATFFLLKTTFANYIGIVNIFPPIIMGLFTTWFQKWYPAKVARG